MLGYIFLACSNVGMGKSGGGGSPIVAGDKNALSSGGAGGITTPSLAEGPSHADLSDAAMNGLFSNTGPCERTSCPWWLLWRFWGRLPLMLSPGAALVLFPLVFERAHLTITG